MRFSFSFTFVLLFLSVIALAFSCNRIKNNVVENVVYYYPEKNIYYDSLRSNYYYSLDGAKTWDSLAFKAPGYGSVLGPKIPIKRTGGNVWVNNKPHRKEYNGVLLNIINNHTIALTKADRINKLRSIVKSETRPEVIVKDTTPERGLKKFFNKLFGKKKKPAEEEKKQ